MPVEARGAPLGVDAAYRAYRLAAQAPFVILALSFSSASPPSLFLLPSSTRCAPSLCVVRFLFHPQLLIYRI